MIARTPKELTALSAPRNRERLRSHFFVRGTAAGFPESLEKREFPSYFVHPAYDMTRSEWVARLEATIHAAVARGISHAFNAYGHVPALRSLPHREFQDTRWRELNSRCPPKLIVFGPLGYDSRVSGIKSVLAERRLKPSGTEGKLNFRHFRPHLEQAIVRGRVQPTFSEHDLVNFGQMGNRKLFEVKLSKRDHARVIARMNALLKKSGFEGRNSLSPARTLVEDYIASFASTAREADEARLWSVVRKALGGTELPKNWFSLETTPRIPFEYLYYAEAAELLTRKFARRMLKFVKSLPNE